MAMDLVARLRMIDNMSAPMRRVAGNVTSLTSKLAGVGTVIAGLGAGAGLLALGSKALKLASDAEQANIAFSTMLGDASKAKLFVDKLSDFANNTPFELPGLRDSAKKMLAFGFSAESVIPMLTGVGNAAAGLSLGSDGVDRLTLALGQMKAKSKVSGDELLQLVEAGVPAYEILAKSMNVSTAQVMKMTAKGIIPADQAIKALVAGMSAKFPDMMSKQSKSLSGLWSTMKDTFDNKLLVRFGEGMASALKPRFDKLTNWINTNKTTIDRWGANIERVAGKASDALIGEFEGAGRYLKTHFFNNADFTNLSGKGKFEFVIEDFKKTFDNWYSAGGDAKISGAVKSLVGYTGDALSKSAPALVEIGANLGKSIADGMLTGLQSVAKSNPLMAALMAGIAVPGPLPVKAGAAVTVAASGYLGQLEEAKPKKSFLGISGDSGVGKALSGISKFTSIPTGFMDGMFGGKPDGSHAGGLDRVPYNGYRAVLHRDETVLTKGEADARRDNRTSKGGGGVTISGNTFNVRKESDIEDIASKLADMIHKAHQAGAGSFAY
jgi:tape measure domain-containing protein